MFIQLIQMQPMLEFSEYYWGYWELTFLPLKVFVFWRERTEYIINNSQNNHIFGTIKFFYLSLD